MSERQWKKIRIEQRLRYLNKLEAWLAEEPAWWRFSARKRWKARRPKNPCGGRVTRHPHFTWSGGYAGQ